MDSVKKIEKFNKLRRMLKGKKVAHAQDDASKDPMKYIENTKNMKIGPKGIAF